MMNYYYWELHVWEHMKKKIQKKRQNKRDDYSKIILKSKEIFGYYKKSMNIIILFLNF